MKERHNGTRLHRNRRILNGPPVSLSRSSHISEKQTGTDGKWENFSRNKSLSSLVVFVLVDGDGDGIMVQSPSLGYSLLCLLIVLNMSPILAYFH
ncbi:hypothetical protein RDI58_010975 [Solanum bulbocastanum]|uniref:Transmembrane protein n=1 Tax=Solanum bulbocastanum TaxID=147425 RepID=A0AAN8TQF2_SOLBU